LVGRISAVVSIALGTRYDATYVKGAGLLHLLLLRSNWAHAPSPGVEIALHDNTLNLCNNTVVTRRHLNGGHLRIGECDGLALGGHQNNLLVDFNALLKSQQTGKHELGTVADGVNGAVLHNNALVARQETL
jgi:hypothetical protein